jgi:peptidoglycan/LPS O-acetylase OafA/YrhL
MTADTTLGSRMTTVEERGGLGSAATATRPRFACFDGLRAIAATAVIVQHVGFQTGASYRYRTLGPFLARMDSGVSLFFLISGFLLYRPFVAANLSDRPEPATGGFYRRRVFRIFPAYWLALSFMALFMGLQLRGGVGALRFYSLTQIYTTKDHLYLRGINQAWSLATEISFYLFLPVYAWVIARLSARRPPERRWAVELAGLIVIGVGGAGFRAFVDLGKPSWHTIGVYWLPSYLDLFAIGMLLALAQVAVRDGAPRRAVDAIGRHPAICWALGAATLWAVAELAGLPRGLETVSGGRELLKHGLYGTLAFFLILPAVFGPQKEGRVRGWLQWRPVAYVGLVSYGVYIWHEALLGQLRSWVGTPLFLGNFYAYLLATFVFSVAVAAVSWHLFERPILAWVRRR